MLNHLLKIKISTDHIYMHNPAIIHSSRHDIVEILLKVALNTITLKG